MGRGENAGIVYLIDFGLAKRYINTKTHTHIPYVENKSLVGTARYSSLNTHMGIEQSRRDDLESVGYSLIYMMRGSLPWQGTKGANKQEKYDKIMEKKMDMSIGELCKKLPIEVAHFMYYCRNLKFEAEPDYEHIKAEFREGFRKTCCFKQFDYDWSSLRCDLTRRTKRASSDSNQAECEDKAKNRNKRKLSRKLAVQNLASGITPRGSARRMDSTFGEQVEKKAEPAVAPSGLLMPNNSPVKEKAEGEEVPEECGKPVVTLELKMGSEEIIQEDGEKEKEQKEAFPEQKHEEEEEEKKPSPEEETKKKAEEDATPKIAKPPEEKKRHEERTDKQEDWRDSEQSWDFQGAEITERAHIHKDYLAERPQEEAIPAEHEEQDAVAVPVSMSMHSSDMLRGHTYEGFNWLNAIKRSGTNQAPQPRMPKPDRGFRKIYSTLNDN